MRFETTPIFTAGRLVVQTPRGRVLSLDPEAGGVRWTFDPRVALRRYAEGFTSRGVGTWQDTAKTPDETCTSRVFVATVDARLFALDATTGRPCAGFGDKGELGLADWAKPTRSPSVEEYSFTSPPTIAGGVVVVGSVVRKSRNGVAASGVVRGFDARTGRLVWSFDPVRASDAKPISSGTSPNGNGRPGGGNVWSIISYDAKRNWVFLPTSSLAPDFYGGRRPGNNEYANSVVALDATTGSVVWSRQLVRHDLWDYDIAAEPVLAKVRLEGIEREVVLAGTKAGMLFVLDRDTGELLLSPEDRLVPKSKVSGEVVAARQLFTTRPRPLLSERFPADSVFGLTRKERESCRELIGRLRNDGLFTPPDLRGTIVWPGFWGGINWDGLAIEPQRQRAIIAIKRVAMGVQIVPLHSPMPATLRIPGAEYMVQGESPYGAIRFPLVSEAGTPCTPPPWSELVAVDLATGRIEWRRTYGSVPWLDTIPQSRAWGSVSFGGPLVTAGGLVFLAGAVDDRIRAFDVESGAVLWEAPLPAGGQATPMTYVHNGKQFVVIAAGGRAGIGSSGDFVVAFALP